MESCGANGLVTARVVLEIVETNLFILRFSADIHNFVPVGDVEIEAVAVGRVWDDAHDVVSSLIRCIERVPDGEATGRYSRSSSRMIPGTPMMDQRSYATGTMGDVGYIEVISRVPVPEGADVEDSIRIGREVSRLARHLYTIIYEGM